MRKQLYIGIILATVIFMIGCSNESVRLIPVKVAPEDLNEISGMSYIPDTLTFYDNKIGVTILTDITESQRMYLGETNKTLKNTYNILSAIIISPEENIHIIASQFYLDAKGNVLWTYSKIYDEKIPPIKNKGTIVNLINAITKTKTRV